MRDRVDKKDQIVLESQCQHIKITEKRIYFLDSKVPSIVRYTIDLTIAIEEKSIKLFTKCLILNLEIF